LAKLVNAEWLAARIGADAITVVDPRRPMKYLAGHLPHAINVPVYKCFAADGALLDPTALAQFLGASGLGDGATPVLYDSPEGQNAAMLAWILEYLGRDDVAIMLEFFETWKKSGREVFYKPVDAAAQRFTARPDAAVRIGVEEARVLPGTRFVDFRSAEEFSGARTIADDRPGHIPGSSNVAWRELGQGEMVLKSAADLKELFAAVGLSSAAEVVAYCRSGPRAALGYLALRQAGYRARLFDGSWAQWSRSGLPAEK